jgi:hypothetical protein
MRYEPCMIGRVRFFYRVGTLLQFSGWWKWNRKYIWGIANKSRESQIKPSPFLPIRYFSIKKAGNPTKKTKKKRKTDKIHYFKLMFRLFSAKAPHPVNTTSPTLLHVAEALFYFICYLTQFFMCPQFTCLLHPSNSYLVKGCLHSIFHCC